MVISQNNSLPGGDIYIVIVAAGSGTRFGSELPKQFLSLAGVPVLVRTFKAFSEVLVQPHIIVVLSPDRFDMWKSFANEYGLPRHTVVAGGATRTESVSNALEAIQNMSCRPDDIIMVHDGARPVLNSEMLGEIAARFDDAAVNAVVPVLPLTEALAAKDGTFVKPADRTAFCTVQTPQAFRASLLIEAYHKAGNVTMADDASVVNHFSDARLLAVPGHTQNIKITNPSDIAIAEVFLKNPVPYRH